MELRFVQMHRKKSKILIGKSWLIETEYISHVIFSWTFLKEITFIGTLTSTAPIQTQTLSVVKRMQAMLHWAIVQPVSMNCWI